LVYIQLKFPGANEASVGPVGSALALENMRKICRGKV
jgi:hypothetical protein